MVLPNFAVIGAAKAGTTSLYHWLRQHPDVYMPTVVKETSFFVYEPTDPEHVAADRHRFPVRSLEEYEALFADAGAALAIGDATPLYLDSPRAPAHMASVIPQARLIASLREPVSRLYSHAQMRIRLGHDTNLGAAMLRMAESDEHLYAPKFRRWFAHFPREQFHIFRYDDLVTDPQDVVRETFRFLGVEPITPEVGERFNPGGVPRSRVLQRVIESPGLRRFRGVAPMAAFRLVGRLRAANQKPAPALDDATRARLAARYRDDVLETQELLGLDLSSWLRDPDIRVD